MAQPLVRDPRLGQCSGPEAPNDPPETAGPRFHHPKFVQTNLGDLIFAHRSSAHRPNGVRPTSFRGCQIFRRSWPIFRQSPASCRATAGLHLFSTLSSTTFVDLDWNFRGSRLSFPSLV